ncbi:MAG: TrmH family RNA methyltransferase [Candidatus Hydrogenedentes bacterium]|nr:TrmH family RNA methyltransferase [Candidatus Hydrogenedentota bacterium]
MADLEPHYAQVPRQDLPQITRNPLHAVIDNFRSAYNVGSVFRTADAGAIQHIHLCGMSAHQPHRKIEKTSLGAFEYVPWTYYERTSDALDWLRAQNVPIVAIEVVDGAIGHTQFAWPKPVAVVFGNEVTGINEKTLAKCDATVCIRMCGFKNSINVATAYGIVQYEILRQWGAV